jgi:hypothetical protein
MMLILAVRLLMLELVSLFNYWIMLFCEVLSKFRYILNLFSYFLTFRIQRVYKTKKVVGFWPLSVVQIFKY